MSPAPKRIPIGQAITGGLGAGGNPVVGEQAAKEDSEVIKGLLEGADMVIITAGMGGGTRNRFCTYCCPACTGTWYSYNCRCNDTV